MALKNVVIGYAKGDKGDKGDTGERGATGQTGPQGESGNIADAAITDTQGLDVEKGAKTTAQKLFDAIADRIVNKLITNDTLTTKLADYLLKSAMSSTNIDSTTNVPTSALVYSLMQDVNNNLSKKLSVGNDIASAYLAIDYSAERLGALSMQFSDGTVNQLLLLKDTAAVTIFRNNEWTEQYRFATKSDVWPQNPGTQIAAGTDMQTITTPGHYYCENNSTAGSLKNCPISDAFTLVVYRSAGGTGDNIYYVAQEYTSYLCNRRVIQTYNKDSKNWTTHEIQFKS